MKHERDPKKLEEYKNFEKKYLEQYGNIPNLTNIQSIKNRQQNKK